MSIIIIIVGICINRFTGYTKEILVSYNEKGFNKKDTEFIEWKHLKSWSIKTKVKYDSLWLYFIMPLGWTADRHINTLKLELDDKRTIIFSNDEIGDIMKFIKFLHHNHKEKLKGKGRL